jgi:hypothetical protein
LNVPSGEAEIKKWAFTMKRLGCVTSKMKLPGVAIKQRCR